MLNKIADHTHVLAHGISTDNADAVQTGAVHGFKVLAEQLVQAADHQHRRTVCGKRTQQVGAMVEVVDDFLLAGVLAAASQNKVHLVGPIVALIVLVNDRFVTVQFQPAADSQHVAGIAVDVHVFGIQGHHINCSGHVTFSLSMFSRCREASYSLTMPLPLAGGGARAPKGGYLPTPASRTSVMRPSTARVLSMAV